jgi:lipoprotein signal peptidase
MPERSYRIVLWTLALLGVSLDQATKYGVFSWLSHTEGHAFWVFKHDDTGFHAFRYFDKSVDDSSKTPGAKLDAQRDLDGLPRVNQGALFGFMGEKKTLANGGFAVISLLAALAIIAWSLQSSTGHDRWLCAALGLILAGTLGNLYDRVVFSGVRDFLHWNYGYNWPVFNIADCCLVCGAGLLLIQAFLTKAAATKTASSETAPALNVASQTTQPS